MHKPNVANTRRGDRSKGGVTPGGVCPEWGMGKFVRHGYV